MGGILLLVLWIAAYFIFFVHLRLGILLTLSAALLLLFIAFLLSHRRSPEVTFSVFSMLSFRPPTHQRLLLLTQEITEKPGLNVRILNRGVPLLAAVLITSVGGVVALTYSPIPILSRTDQLSEDAWMTLVFVFILCLFPVRLAMNWLGECWYLRFSEISLGFVTGKEHRFSGATVTYEFRNVEGEFYGGTDRERQGIGADNCVIVFAAPFNPDLNKPHCSFRFYEFKTAPNNVMLPE